MSSPDDDLVELGRRYASAIVELTPEVSPGKVDAVKILKALMLAVMMLKSAFDNAARQRDQDDSFEGMVTRIFGTTRPPTRFDA